MRSTTTSCPKSPPALRMVAVSVAIAGLVLTTITVAAVSEEVPVGVEIVVVVDESGSLGEEQAALSSSAEVLEQAAGDAGLDAAFGVVGFGAGDGHEGMQDGAPHVHTSADGSHDLATGLAELTTDGAVEPGLDAIVLATGDQAGPGDRTGRCVLLVTDEPANGDTATQADAVDALSSTRTRLFPIVSQAAIDPYGSLATLDPSGTPQLFVASGSEVAFVAVSAIEACAQSFQWQLWLEATPASVPVGEQVTLTAAVRDWAGFAVEGASVSLVADEGPSAGATMEIVTGSDGTGSVTYTSQDAGSDTWTGSTTGPFGNQHVASDTVTFEPVNDAPTAADDAYSTDEDTALVVAAPGVLGNDADVDGDSLSAQLVSAPSNGTVELNADGSFTYTPDLDFTGTDTFTYTVADDHGATDTATVTITVVPVNDAPVVVSVSPDEQTVDHSDGIVPVTVIARDVDGDPLTLAASGLPDGVTASSATCTDLGVVPSECTWTLSGVVTSPAGVFTGTATVSDGELSDAAAVAATVEAEDATVSPDEANPVAVQVAEAGGASGIFTLSAVVGELVPDQASGTAAAGELSTAVVSITLVPVGPGSTVGPITCGNGPVEGAGYDQQLTASCDFDGVEVNTYTVQITVDGGYWTGAGEDVLTVSDPSLGSATGGGTFYWPDTADPDSGYLGDRTSFGFTMSYNKKGTNLRGSLLVIRHLPDGTKFRVKSNALDGLALGEDPAVPMGWASFSGKATYLQPGWDEPEGNHAFTVYVEDRDEPGTGTDRFWLATRDKDGQTIDAFSLQEPAADNAQPLTGGNIVVPHRQAQKR